MSRAAPLGLGSHARRLLESARETLSIEALDRQVVLLAFLADFVPSEARSEAVRAELRGLGAVLIVVSAEGTFVVRADDEVEAVPDSFGVRRHEDESAALFLFD